MFNIEVKASATVLRLYEIDTKNFEFDGKVSNVLLAKVKGHIEINCSLDMNNSCDSLKGRLDINQILATTILNIPKGSSYYVRRKGLSNNILYSLDNHPVDSLSDKTSENTIELNGMNSELTINEYSSMEETNE